MRGEGGEWSARVRSGEGPSAGAFGLEFPSKGIRRELFFFLLLEFPSKGIRRELEGNSVEFPSKGIRRELEGCWKYYASCRYGLPVICPCNYRPVITGVITCNYSPPFPVTSNW